MDPLEILKLLSSKPIVVGLAITGAVFTILPNLFSRKPTVENLTIDEDRGNRDGTRSTWEKLANKIESFGTAISKKTKSYMRESFEYIKNQAKWQAAKSYCEDNGLEFKIISEKDLGQY